MKEPAPSYESASSDQRLHVIVEVSPLALGWVATLTVTNRSRETLPDVVGTVCLLLHASRFFVDPEWKRTYYRSGGRFLSYFGRERDGGQPVYQMSLVTGRRQIERTPRHVDKWGFTREPSDDGIIAVVGQDCETTLVTTWEPTHHLQANRKGTFHCVHANALVGTLEAACWMADRRIGLLGMDTPTPSADWKECDHILLKQGVEIVIVEGLTNLEKLPGQFTFIGFPLNLKGRDGAPIRAVAVLD